MGGSYKLFESFVTGGNLTSKELIDFKNKCKIFGYAGDYKVQSFKLIKHLEPIHHVHDNQGVYLSVSKRSNPVISENLAFFMNNFQGILDLAIRQKQLEEAIKVEEAIKAMNKIK